MPARKGQLQGYRHRIQDRAVEKISNKPIEMSLRLRQVRRGPDTDARPQGLYTAWTPFTSDSKSDAAQDPQPAEVQLYLTRRREQRHAPLQDCNKFLQPLKVAKAQSRGTLAEVAWPRPRFECQKFQNFKVVNLQGLECCCSSGCITATLRAQSQSWIGLLAAESQDGARTLKTGTIVAVDRETSFFWDGYRITITDQEICLSTSNEQSCCEDFGISLSLPAGARML